MAGTIIISFILTKALWGRYYYFSHFIGKQTDSEVKSLSQGHTAASDEPIQTQPVSWTANADTSTHIYYVQETQFCNLRRFRLDFSLFLYLYAFQVQDRESK